MAGSRLDTLDKEQSSIQCLRTDSERFSIFRRLIPFARPPHRWKFNDHYGVGGRLALHFFNRSTPNDITAAIFFDGSLR